MELDAQLQEKEIAPAEEVVSDVEAVADAPAEVAVAAPEADRARLSDRRGGNRERRQRRASARPPRARSEFDQRIIRINRVSRTVAGGRRFSFSVAIIIGNKKGKVGVGLGKAGDTSLAVDKAVRDAKRNMITVLLTKDASIAHGVSSKYCASRVTIMPVKGRGLVAGSSVRPVLELAGVSNVIAKINSGSKNGLNNARAAIDALRELKA